MMERGDDDDEDDADNADLEINKDLGYEDREGDEENEEEKLVDDSEDNHFLGDSLNRGLGDDSKTPVTATTSTEPGASTSAIAPVTFAFFSTP